jgi:hypothetical protein
MDKRGVGKSSWLDCPVGSFLDGNFTKCVEFARANKARVMGNTYTNTALDLKRYFVVAAPALKSRFVIPQADYAVGHR